MHRQIRHWLFIVLATVIGVAVPIGYFWRAEIGLMIRNKIARARLVTQNNWYVPGTYLAKNRASRTVHYSSATGHYESRRGGPLPTLSAEAFLVADLDTGQSIIERNAREAYPIASITKLMTSVVSLETINQNQMAQVSKTAMSAFGYAGQLSSGEKFRVRDLLFPLLLESSNKTAEVIAETGGRDNFLAQMNIKAKLLGMEATNYDDPSGISPRNVSSAADLAVLSKYIFDYHPEVLNITLEKTHRDYGRIWYNKNKIVNLDNYIGGKDGYTDEALTTDISIFSLPFESNQKPERRIVIVLLRCRSKMADMESILRYLKNEISYVG